MLWEQTLSWRNFCESADKFVIKVWRNCGSWVSHIGMWMIKVSRQLAYQKTKQINGGDNQLIIAYWTETEAVGTHTEGLGKSFLQRSPSFYSSAHVSPSPPAPPGQWPALISATQPEACWCSTSATANPLTTSRSGTPRCASTCSLTPSCSCWWARRATWMLKGREWWAAKRPRSWLKSSGRPTRRFPPRRATTSETPSSSSPSASTRACWVARWRCRTAGMASSAPHSSCFTPAEPVRPGPRRRSAVVKRWTPARGRVGGGGGSSFGCAHPSWKPPVKRHPLHRCC